MTGAEETPATESPHPGRSDKQSDERISIDQRYGPVSEVFAALASPLRAAIVHRLTTREQTVAELVELLGAAQPLVSQHLGRLRQAGLVSGERHGRQIVYRIADEHVAHILLDAYQHSSETRVTQVSDTGARNENPSEDPDQ